MQPLIHEAISASAGSGKTFQLAHRYIRLMVQGVPPDRICALTFSRKAAGEIFDSIVGYLAAATDRAGAEVMAERIGATGLDAGAFLKLLRLFVENLHRQHIGTLDSFMIGVARAFPTELGIPVDFQVLDKDGTAAAELRQQVLGAIFVPQHADPGAQREFFEAFKQATFGEENKQLAEKVAEFVGTGRAAYQSLPRETGWGQQRAIWADRAFWLEPAGDVNAAADGLLPLLESRGLPAQMLGSFAKIVEFARGYGPTGAWDGSLTSNRVFEQLLEQGPALAAGTVTLEYRRRDHTLSGEVCARLLTLLRHVMAVELQRSLEQTQGLFRVLRQYETLYDAVMRRTGRLTFDDAQYLLTEGNAYSGGALLSRTVGQEGRLYIDYRLDCKLDHWLLDEFQDTSDLQWQALRNLADEILQDDSGRRSFFYVGDVKQAIYGWRGGNARLFDRILENYGERIARRPLNTSFRSCQPVIDTVNRVFGNLADAGLPDGAAAEWARNWQEHRCERGRVPADGYAALIEPPRGPTGEKPDAEDRRVVVARILRQVDPVRRGLSAAVLVRSNEEGRKVVAALARECQGMQVVHEGKAGIRDNAAVSLLLALVALAEHPGDTLAWRQLQMSPLRAALDEAGLDRDSLAVSLLRQIHTGGFQPFVRDWAARLRARAPLEPFAARRLDDLTAAAGEFDAGGRRGAGPFLRFMDEYQLRQEAAPDAVRVMTVHQAKGLGFDVVILPELMSRSMIGGKVDLTLGRDPATNQAVWALKMPRRIVAASDPALAPHLLRAQVDACLDALCVLYVGMTRAKHALYMVTSFPGETSGTLNPAAFLKAQLLDEPNPGDGAPIEMDGAPLACLYAQGRRDWYEPIRRARAEPTRAGPALPGDYAARPARRTRLRRIEPSGEEELVRQAGWLFDPLNRKVLDFGNAIHALFSRFTWTGEADPDALIAQWRKTATVAEDVARDACDQFRRAIEAEEVRQALRKPAGRVELWLEKSFEIVLSGQLVSGAFDRVAITRDEAGAPVSAVVTDFKSNRLEREAELVRSVGHYTPQLALYGRALADILKLAPDRVALQLLYTRPGRVFAVKPVRADAGPREC